MFAIWLFLGGVMSRFMRGQVWSAHARASFFESVISVRLILLSFATWSYVGGVARYSLLVGVSCIF